MSIGPIRLAANPVGKTDGSHSSLLSFTTTSVFDVILTLKNSQPFSIMRIFRLVSEAFLDVDLIQYLLLIAFIEFVLWSHNTVVHNLRV